MIVVKLYIKIKQFVQVSLYKSFSLVVMLLLLNSPLLAQINFGGFDSSYPLTLTAPLEGLVFPDPIHIDSGLNQLELAEAIILEIEGLKQLDVGVLITADLLLLKDGNPANSDVPERRISFTLKANYSNVGSVQGHNKIGSTYIDLTGNMGNVRFPILERQFNAPGPPPLPPGTFTPAEHLEIAELYFYGDINVGTVEGGTYTGSISITIEYDNPPLEHPPGE